MLSSPCTTCNTLEMKSNNMHAIHPLLGRSILACWGSNAGASCLMLQRKCTLDFHSLPRPGADTMATEAASRVGLQTFTRDSKLVLGI